VQTLAQLRGERQLPWEAEGEREELLGVVGAFRGILSDLLQRDPARRPTMKRVCEAWRRVQDEAKRAAEEAAAAARAAEEDSP
jgi:hypothetical protein